MTAETLKPFITPTSDSFPATHAANVRMSRRERNCNLLTISLSVSALLMVAILLGFTIWNSMRVCNLESDVRSLSRLVENMQKRLGLQYLDDLQDFEKEYQNALIDNPSTLDVIGDDDDDDDDDDDEDDEDDDDDGDGTGHGDSIIPDTDDEYDEIDSYDELVKKYNSYDDSGDDEDDDDEDDEASNLSDNDNLYIDFEKFKDSKKKKESVRNRRSIAQTPQTSNEKLFSKMDTVTEATKDAPVHHRQPLKVKPRAHLANHDALHGNDGPQKYNFVAQRIEDRHQTPLRPRTHRRRQKNPALKNAKRDTRTLSASAFKPAAHFHLNRKIPDRDTTVKVRSYSGDLYIGHPTWSNDLNHFQVNNGMLTVVEPGLYYVYAQVCYNNTHDQNGFVIFHGHKPFLQCLNTVPTNMPLKIHTCHTSGLIYLQPDETVHIRDFHSDRNAILKESNNRSYFGLIKV